ncbi:GumC family protein [Aporhodopirellula aestuarii]|uniref:Wzz/FepE/Etk N-terminal domain-containing protein n=1 Tax=Aporhodopirellula aestuarii TaxID=2950107 RepID=A0ABT0U7R7_9BACT|nr:Wzz/FepE/Etk N-terminal domain-containing protein [Aporhodopirellula aestuarii]MCM2372988.1 Wzz/FepE/Etk N-terminal domain-containing protein [Aporhodopirellula aestuarii]
MNHAPPPDNGIDLDHFRPMRLDDLFGAFWRHRVSAVVVATLLLPFLLLAVFLIPAQYDSYAQLLVRLGRGAVSLDPTASLSPSVSLQDSRSSQVNSVREMLQSRVMAQRVVREVGAQRILEPRSTISKLSKNLTGWIPAGEPRPLGDMSAEEVTAQIQEELAIMKFQKAMDLFTAPDSYTIDLEVRTEDPFLSRDLLNTLIEVYQEHHAAAHRSEGSYEFFAEQANIAYERAMAAKEALRLAHSDRGMIDVGSSQTALRTLLSRIEGDLVQTESELASAVSEIQGLSDEIQSSPSTIESEVIHGIPKTTASTMRQSLYDLEVQYHELDAKYKDDHPKMRALREQLAASSKIANTERGDQPQTREAINPIRQSLELSRRQTLSRLAGLKSKQRELNSQREKLLEDLDQLNHDEVDLTQMNWEASLAEQEYLRAAEARDNAKMIDQLASGRVSEIAVVQDASLGLKKVKPQRGILAILVTVLAFAFGIFQAVTRGLLFDRTPNHAVRRGGLTSRIGPRFDRPNEESREFVTTNESAHHGSARMPGLSSIRDELVDSPSALGVPR